MKKFFSTIFIALTVIVASACGGGGSASSSSTPTGGGSTGGGGGTPPTVTYGKFRPLKSASTPKMTMTPTTVGNPSVTMSIPRSGHKAIMLNDGKVMLIGGEGLGVGQGNLPAASQIDLFDPATETFTLSPATCTVYRGYVDDKDFALLKLTDGRVLMVGQFKGTDPGVEIYDHSTETVTPIANPFPAGDNIVWVSGLYQVSPTKVLVTDATEALTQSYVNGVLTNHEGIQQCYLLDLTTMQATAIPTSPATHSLWRESVQTPDGSVYMLGGTSLIDDAITSSTADIYRYDSTTNSFSVVGQMAVRDSAMGVNVLPNGKIGIYGGTQFPAVSGSPVRVTAVQVFDPTNDVTSTVANLPKSCSLQSALYLQNGWVLNAGGVDDQGTPADTEYIYDTKQNFTGVTGNLSVKRLYYSGVELNNGLTLISGGQDDYGHPTATAEIYDTTTKLAIGYTSDSILTTDTAQFNTNYAAGVNWSVAAINGTSNPGSIDTNGLWTPNVAGKFVITATAKDNSALANSVVITVTDAPVVVTGPSTTITVSSTEQFSVNYPQVTWSVTANDGVSNPGTISSSGLWTPSAVGQYTITAAVSPALTGSIVITVTN